MGAIISDARIECSNLSIKTSVVPYMTWIRG